MPDGVWTSRTDMPLPAREYQGGSDIGVNTGYVCYGYENVGDTAVRDTDEYNRVGDFWSTKAEAPTPARLDFGAVTIGSDKMYAFAGGNAPHSGPENDNDEYSQAGNSWSAKTLVPGYDRWGPIAFTIGSDKGYCCSGIRGLLPLLEDCNEYSQAGNSWSTKTDVPYPARSRSAGFSIGLFGYMAGGEDSYGDTTNGIYDTDKYDQAGNSWSAGPDLPAPDRNSPGGCVMDVNGYVMGGSAYVQDCEEYDSVQNLWFSKADMSPPGRTAAVSISLVDVDKNSYCIGGKSDYNTSLQDNDEFHMPNVPWVESLSPADETINVAVDTNIEFDIKDDVGVDPLTITVKVGANFAIINGVIQAGFSGSIVAL